MSGVDIDFLNIALEDNVTSFQRQRIGSDDVSPQMRHDLELDMKHAPVLQVDDRLAQQEIGSKASLSLEIVSRGKPGL